VQFIFCVVVVAVQFERVFVHVWVIYPPEHDEFMQVRFAEHVWLALVQLFGAPGVGAQFCQLSLEFRLHDLPVTEFVQE